MQPSFIQNLLRWAIFPVIILGAGVTLQFLALKYTDRAVTEALMFVWRLVTNG